MRLLYLGDTGSPLFRVWPTHFAAAGHEVHVCHLVQAPAGEPIPEATTHPTPTAMASRIPRGWLASAADVRRLGGSLNPDVVHSHQVMPPGYLAELGGLAPHVSTAWGSEVLLAKRRHRRLIRRVARGAGLITADSHHLLEAIGRFGAPQDRLRWVPWGVSAEWRRPAEGLSREEAAAEAVLPADRPLVLSHRGTRAIYRQDVFLRAIARVRAGVPDVLGVVLAPAGPGDDPRLAGLIEQLELAPNLLLLPPMPHERMAFAFRAAQVCISVPESDSAPTSVFEALAMGTPAIVSDLPWVREPVYDEARMEVVPVGDDAALAAAITEALAGTDPAVIKHNRSLVEERFDRDRIFAGVMAEYERLAGEGG